MKTIVKLPNTQEKTFIEVFNDERLVAHIWGVVDEVKAMENGRWHVCINCGDTLSFLYPDFIEVKR